MFSFEAYEPMSFMAMASLKEILFELESLDFGERDER